MRFFVFGREVIPKWFVEAINKEEIVYEYKENKIVVVFSVVAFVGCLLAGLCVYFG